MPFKNSPQEEDLWEDDLPDKDDVDKHIEDGSKSGREGRDEPVSVYGDATTDYPDEDPKNK